MNWFATAAPPPWFVEAGRLIGTTEIPGAKSNATILAWAKALGGWIASFYRDDNTAWCGLFVAHCIKVGLPGEALPANPLGALEWRTFGVAGLAAPGAVLVFRRPGAGAGHVGFYVAETADAYLVRGGNQSNKVCEEWIAKNRCVAIRWPASAPRQGGPIILSGKTPGKVSANES